ncbi:hypothetical protein FYC62_02250 [Pedobacter aquae]|uniref:Outer membrane protein beta-barrel domain-containing protein n=1 Tax=Pedobacter aquae TaxID=2605747 RepID=A0A5C0VD09_9SPHI|nr:hypothetical protein [Pedobacter aquae]QEK50618.1 hypothetical protein FYC62_02250 [Pedobacter aquae]
MNEQFDKELRDHIKDTFDIYNDQMADDGWKKYQQKVQRKKLRAFLLWSVPSGMAAALAILWLLNMTVQTETQEELTPIKISKNIIQKPSATINSEDEPKPKDIEITLGKQTNESSENVIKQEEAFIKNQKAKRQNPTTLASNFVVDDYFFLNDTLASPLEISPKSIITQLTQHHIASVDFAPSTSEIIAANKTNNKSLGNSSPVLALASTPQSAYSGDIKKSVVKPFKTLKKLKLGLDASTFMNFTREGVSEDINLAIGIISEYKLSNKFSLSSGFNINKQTAAFISSNPQQNNAASEKAFANAMATVVTQNFSNARLVGIDIPLQVKYTSSAKKINWFVTSGFSSYTLLNERYLNNISVVNYGFAGVETNNIVLKEENNNNLFSNLQLARTLNFSVGVNIPVKNVTSLAIEPFIKYPIRTVGNERLEIGSGGISFRLNLNNSLFK